MVPKNRDITVAVRNAWIGLGVESYPDPNHIVTFYTEPQRHYHTLEHLRECFAWFEETRNIAYRPDEMLLALAYHDAVYIPENRDNEEKSADLFRDLAYKTDLQDRNVEWRISGLIEHTASHKPEGGGDVQLMTDIDLSILGSSPYQYQLYAQRIRKEYSFVSDSIYRTERAKVLSSFLGRPYIYHTSFFHEKLEEQARANLYRELCLLNGTRPHLYKKEQK